MLTPKTYHCECLTVGRRTFQAYGDLTMEARGIWMDYGAFRKYGEHPWVRVVWNTFFHISSGHSTNAMETDQFIDDFPPKKPPFIITQSMNTIIIYVYTPHRVL